MEFIDYFVPIAQEDIKLIKDNQPDLVYNAKSNTLSGYLAFKADFRGREISDEYKIEIDLNHIKPLPVVKEVGGKIERLSTKKNRNLQDFHVNKGDMNDGLCLCSRLKSFEYFNQFKHSLNPLFDFIKELVIPFFYGISYFEKFNRFPFGEFSHGEAGLLQEIEENLSLWRYLESYAKTYPTEYKEFLFAYSNMLSDKGFFKRKKIGRNEGCPCNSGTKYKKCHLPIINIMQRKL